jgi:hypothetical protein
MLELASDSRVVSAPIHLLDQLRDWWRLTLRVADYPSDAGDWSRLLDSPVPLALPVDWGLALAPYRRRGRFGRRATPLGRLLDAYLRNGDMMAGEALAALLAHWFVRLDIALHFDLMATYPREWRSGPGYHMDRLLSWPGLSWPLPLKPDCWVYRAAVSRHRLSRGDALAQIDAYLDVTAAVCGQRVLVMEAVHEDPAWTSACAGLLRERGALKVGILALCVREERARDT